LKRLSELEDRNARENERRRDYRSQIDDFHKILGEERLDMSKKQKAELCRDAIKQEAEFVRHLGEEERRKKFAQMDRYNHDLGQQIKNKETQWVRDGLVDDDAYARHTGLPLGSMLSLQKMNC